MRNNTPLIPKLRFPEFSGEWEKIPMGTLYSFKANNSFSRDQLNYISGVVKNIHYGDIHTKYSSHFYINKENVPYINPSVPIQRINIENYCIEGDMIFADASEDMADIGKSIELIDINGERLLSGLHTILARQKINALAIGFGGHLFKSAIIRDQIKIEAHGTKVLGISSRRLSNINIFYPANKLEQQKIADCLSSLDDLITAENKKLDALKTHKKGLMQQLFPAEGETVPRLRFPEFSGDWIPTPIGKKVDLLSGYPFDGEDISTDCNGIRLLRGINITEGEIRHSLDIDRYFLNSIERLEKFKVINDDLVIAMDGSKVGKNVALVTMADEGALLVQRVARLRNNGSASIKYIFQWINSVRFQSYVDRINTSSGIPHISAKQINEFEIPFPCVEEQQKIADFLSSVDELISAQIQKIDALKIHKKGLMQQLFPVLSH